MANKTPSFNPSIPVEYTISGSTIENQIDMTTTTVDIVCDTEVWINGNSYEFALDTETEVCLSELEIPDITVNLNLSMMDVYKAFLKNYPDGAELFVRAALAVAMSELKQQWYSKGATDFMGKNNNAE